MSLFHRHSWSMWELVEAPSPGWELAYAMYPEQERRCSRCGEYQIRFVR